MKKSIPEDVQNAVQRMYSEDKEDAIFGIFYKEVDKKPTVVVNGGDWFESNHCDVIAKEAGIAISYEGEISDNSFFIDKGYVEVLREAIVTPKESDDVESYPTYNDEIIRSNTLYHDEKLHNIHKDGFDKGVIAGVQWQKKRSYSREEVEVLLRNAMDFKNPIVITFSEKNEWISKNLKK